MELVRFWKIKRSSGPFVYQNHAIPGNSISVVDGIKVYPAEESDTEQDEENVLESRLVFHDSIFDKSKNNWQNSCRFQKRRIFVTLVPNDRAGSPNTEGFFITLKNKDVALPCSDRNSLNAPVEGASKGRGGIPFLLPPHNLLKMLKNSTNAIGTNLPIGTNPSQKIINELLVSDDTDHLRDHLRTMLDTFLLEEHDMALRRKVFASFKTIDRMLFEVEQIDKLNTKVA